MRQRPDDDQTAKSPFLSASCCSVRAAYLKGASISKPAVSDTVSKIALILCVFRQIYSGRATDVPLGHHCFSAPIPAHRANSRRLRTLRKELDCQRDVVDGLEKRIENQVWWHRVARTPPSNETISNSHLKKLPNSKHEAISLSFPWAYCQRIRRFSQHSLSDLSLMLVLTVDLCQLDREMV